MAKRRKRRATRKQLAALAKGRAALRKLRNPKRRHRRASRKALARRRRSRVKHKNPIGIGEIAIMSNPKRRRAKRRSHRRTRRSRGMSLFKNPGGAVLSAVTSGPKEVLKGDFLKDAAAVSVGFLVPNQVLMRLPRAMVDSTPKAYASKAGIVLASALIAGKVAGPRARRGVLIGGVLGLIVDAWTDFVAPAVDNAMAPKPAGVSAYYGRDLGAYYGRDLAGVHGGSSSPAGIFEGDDD